MHPAKFLGREADIEIKVEMSAEEKALRLQSIAALVSGFRQEAINARKVSGIEDVWMTCEEAYLGVDDMNRADYAKAKWAKPTSMQGPITSDRPVADPTRSTAFVPLARRYADNATAKLCEILLPIDDKPFSLEPTPISDLVGTVVKEAQEVAQASPELQNVIGVASEAGLNEMPVIDKIPQDTESAKTAAEKAEKRIYDWMIESKYPAEVRKVAKDSARLGAGVLKGPFPDVKVSRAATVEGETIALEIKKEIKPAMKWVDVWNIFPADGCGENIHDGNYIFERDYLSSKGMKALKGQDGYIDEAIDAVLKEGPNAIFEEAKSPNKDKLQKHNYELWYFYGTLKVADLRSTNAVGLDSISDDVEEAYAIVTMVNDRVIRVILNPLDSGTFPYHVMSWSRRPGCWAGVGVIEQIAMPQRMINAATRSMLNNLGIGSGPQIVINKELIFPANNRWEVTPNKVWYLSGEAQDSDVNRAFSTFKIDTVFNEMMGAIQYAERLAEQSSGIPLITQGQTGPYTPQTFGQAQLQDNNAHTWLRSIAYEFDDSITEPIVNALYEWLLLDDSIPNDEKGDFKINANGSIALVERAIQEQTLLGMLNAASNPAFGVDPKKLFAEYLKSKHLDPRKIQFTKEELAEQAQQQPVPPPQIQAAQIRAQADAQKTQALLAADAQKTQAELEVELKKAELQANTVMSRAQIDTDRDTAYVQAQDRKNQNDAQARMQELMVKRELALLEYANREKINLDKVKADLARESMKLQTQKELSAAAMELDSTNAKVSPQVATPAIEPIGRAENGKAFEQ